jgi:prepilin-type N-terminal cleavage/methylation domain-containing protein
MHPPPLPDSARPARPFRRAPGRRGFTLIELLTVIVIMLTVSALSITAVHGLFSSTGYDGSLSRIVGILEQARSYAVAQDTYVWVAFYPLDPSKLPGNQDSSGDQLYVGVFASSSGSNPLSWGNSSPCSIPYTDQSTGAIIFQVSKIQFFKQIRIWPQGGNDGAYYNIASLPSSFLPTPAASTPIFSVQTPTAVLSAQPVPAATGDSAIAVVAFTPTGSAVAGPSLSSSIGIDFQPMKSSSVADTANLATIRINGLTGLPSLYRQ